MPFYENFYAGSSSNARGFQSNTIGPKASIKMAPTLAGTIMMITKTVPESGCKSDDAVGSNAMAVASLEFTPRRRSSAKSMPTSVRTSLLPGIWVPFGMNGIRHHLRRQRAGLQRSVQHPYVRGYRITMDVPIGAVGLPTPSRLKSNDGDKAEQFQLNIGKTRTVHCSGRIGSVAMTSWRCPQ